VYEYHYEIFGPLSRLTSRLTGTDTRPFGWNTKEWNNWMDHDFARLREEKLAKDAKAAEEAKVK
ncbi:MAG: hypothetical protein ACOYN0_11810, partial [Phycisphaerales bacterium]